MQHSPVEPTIDTENEQSEDPIILNVNKHDEIENSDEELNE